jgi:hypothetical protein
VQTRYSRGKEAFWDATAYLGLVNPALLQILAAFGLSSASGLNATLPLLIVSLLARMHLIHLSSPYDALQSDVAFYGLLGLAVLEFLVDKVPALDSVAHAVMLPLSAATGAILFASQTGAVNVVDPGLMLLLSLLLGGITAGSVHTTRAAVRPVANVALLGPPISFGEDVSATVLALTALLAPIMLPVALLLLLVLGWRLLGPLRRGSRFRFPTFP